MSAIEDVIAKVVFDLSQLEQKSWFEVVRRVIIESQEMGRREARAELAQLRARIAELEQDMSEARELIARAKDTYVECAQAGYDYYDDVDMACAWLAEHPAPTAGSDATTLDERM
jgi:hypothetical protein